MSVSPRIKRGWAIGLPLIAVGLIAAPPRSVRTEIAPPTPEGFQRAIAARDAAIAALQRRVEALEEDALKADLLRRAGAFEGVVAATVAEPDTAGRTRGGGGRVAGPPPALVAALAAAGGATAGGRAGGPIAAATLAPEAGRRPPSGAPASTAASQTATPPEETTTLAAMTAPASAADGRQPEPPIGVPLTEAEYAAITGGAVDPDAEQRRDGPGSAEDLDAALRALERTLVQEGGLLLPEWAFEVSSEIGYTYDNSGSLQLVNGVGAVDRDVRRDTIENSVTLRVGLPWATQADLRVPYIVNQEQVTTSGLDDRHSSGSGLGDIEVGLTKQLLWETDLAPDVLGSVRWKTATGESAFETDDGELAVGGGFHAVSGHLTAVKSREPLVFFGNLSYTGNLPDSKSGVDINPGDTIGLSLGSILAAGPGTSLRSGLDLSFSRETEVNGRDVPGSDGVSAVLELGAAAVLPFTESKSLLSVTAGIGVTDDAPDLQVKVALPYRF